MLCIKKKKYAYTLDIVKEKWSMCLFLQVFRKLELPAESERLSALKTAMLLKRQELIYSINNSRIANLAEWVIARFTPFSTKSATSKKIQKYKIFELLSTLIELVCVCVCVLFL